MPRLATALAACLGLWAAATVRADDGAEQPAASSRTSKPSVAAKTRTTSQTKQTVRAKSPAHAALADNNPRGALRLLDDRTVRLTPGDRSSVAGQAYFMLNRFAEARRELINAVRLRPSSAIDHYWLARTYAASGSPALAASRYEQAEWCGMETAELHYYWALALQAVGSPLGRVERRLCPAGAQPKPGDFTLGGIIVAVTTERPIEITLCEQNSALGHALRCVQLDPTCGDCWKLAGDIWLAAKEPATASNMYAEAAELLKGKAKGVCLLSWAECALSLGQLDHYLSRMRDGLILSDKKMDSARLAAAFDTVAGEVALRGELSRQIRYLKLAVELQSTPTRRIALAEALMQARDPAEALSQLRAAREEGPTAEQTQRIDAVTQQAGFFAAPP